MSSSVECNSLFSRKTLTVNVFDALKSTNLVEQLEIAIEEYGAL